jgi:hypothetical protein
MTMAHGLLTKLLNYVLEQEKEIEPRGFNLASRKEFLKGKSDLQGLPGIDFDIKIEGDHTWLRVERLEAHTPPVLQDEKHKGLIVIDQAPTGQAPRIDEIALKHRIAVASAGKSLEEVQASETRAKAQLTRVLNEYVPLWSAWAEGEKPRRKTIWS